MPGSAYYRPIRRLASKRPVAGPARRARALCYHARARHEAHALQPQARAVVALAARRARRRRSRRRPARGLRALSRRRSSATARAPSSRSSTSRRTSRSSCTSASPRGSRSATPIRYLAELAASVARTRPGSAASSFSCRSPECRLYAPVRPLKLIAIGRNYPGYTRNPGKERGAVPAAFMKPLSSITGPGRDIVKPRACARARFRDRARGRHRQEVQARVRARRVRRRRRLHDPERRHGARRRRGASAKAGTCSSRRRSTPSRRWARGW